MKTTDRGNYDPSWVTLNSVTDVAGYDCPNEDDATVVCEIHLSDLRRDSVAVADDLIEVVVGELLMSCLKLSLNRYYHVADDREFGESVAVVAVVRDGGVVDDDDDDADGDDREEGEGDGEQLRSFVVIDDDGEQ